MKIRRKAICAFLAVSLLAAALVLFLARERKECCLCASFRYHAPCLLDLETGGLVELGLYLPHESLVAELAPIQPEQNTISFFNFENVTGVVDTGRKRVVIKVPSADKTGNPALCRTCRKQLPPGYRGRYALADLYGLKNKVLVGIVDEQQWTVRCYEVAMTADREEDCITVVVEGMLENKTGLPQ